MFDKKNNKLRHSGSGEGVSDLMQQFFRSKRTKMKNICAYKNVFCAFEMQLLKILQHSIKMLVSCFFYVLRYAKAVF